MRDRLRIAGRRRPDTLTAQTHSRLAHRMQSRQGPGHSTAVANQDPGVGVCGTVGGRRWSGLCRLDVFQLVLTLNSVF